MKPCIISTRAKSKDGYPLLNKEYYGYSLEHRYVYARTNNKKLTTKDIIRHVCDNPGCIEPSHLVLGSQKDNVQDSVIRNRHINPILKGESNGNSKLTQDLVNQIRELALVYTNSELSKMFNVSRSTIISVIELRTWK